MSARKPLTESKIYKLQEIAQTDYLELDDDEFGGHRGIDLDRSTRVRIFGRITIADGAILGFRQTRLAPFIEALTTTYPAPKSRKKPSYSTSALAPAQP